MIILYLFIVNKMEFTKPKCSLVLFKTLKYEAALVWIYWRSFNGHKRAFWRYKKPTFQFGCFDLKYDTSSK